ncbi:hypothetical protein DFP72DRAFT_1121817 [Ephemerocybe angulata]|uniref:Nephrocystin 3-like N-terminal domain-containing protein n=1 Tax=Ephemerocybe angulata TaxID=980116 RepID=A0A8H6M4H6_9AGAR|nr:hypothetical protein DFP72DRAFT_1121817 [Tulosesus angulatus]
MAHVPPTKSAANSAATSLDHNEFSASSSLPEARRSLDALASTSPAGTNPSLNIIHNTTNYFVKSAKNVSMGPNHGTINQNSGSGELEEESYLAALDFLSRHMAAGAIHDSKERCDAPKCMPETRVAVQEEILSWITDGHNEADPKRILWVTGPAGTGKTAIMGTIAERCKAEGLLAATFFFSFSGSLARRSKTHLVSTLAYQLLENKGLDRVGQVRACISQAIRRSPAILQKRLQTQVEELILLPFRQGGPGLNFVTLTPPAVRIITGAGPMSQNRMAIIIDGLDECDCIEDEPRNRRTKEDEQREILSTILHAVTDPSFPFIVIIASRPELAIREFFSTGLARDATRELFLDDKYDPSADIRLFYEVKFFFIRRRFNLSPEWPSLQVLLELVANASGQFIYAATVMRFIEGPPPGSKDKSRCLDLDEVFDRIPKSMLYHVLAYGSDEHVILNFSSADVFKAAEGSMLSCNARKWAEYLTVPETGVPVSHDRSRSQYLISQMFYIVHVWCPKIRCRRACKHWREAILDVLKREGWAVPSPMDLFRDSWVHRYTFEELSALFVPSAETNDN